MTIDLNTNNYFKDMERIAHDYEAKREAWLLEGGELRAAGSSDMEAWEERKPHFPFTKGQMAAYNAWYKSVCRNSSELECDDLPGRRKRNIEDFSEALKATGVKTLAVTDWGETVFDALRILDGLGWRIEGLCTVTRTDESYGCAEDTEVNGIRLVRTDTEGTAHRRGKEYIIDGKTYSESEILKICDFWQRKQEGETLRSLILQIQSDTEDINFARWLGTHSMDVMDYLFEARQQEQFFNQLQDVEEDIITDMAQRIREDLYEAGKD